MLACGSELFTRHLEDSIPRGGSDPLKNADDLCSSRLRGNTKNLIGNVTCMVKVLG